MDMENTQKGARPKKSCTSAQTHQENIVTLICDNKHAKKRSTEPLKRINIVDIDSLTFSIQQILLQDSSKEKKQSATNLKSIGTNKSLSTIPEQAAIDDSEFQGEAIFPPPTSTEQHNIDEAILQDEAAAYPPNDMTNHYELESFYEVPTTMQQFTRDWNAIHFHEHLRYRYLSSIEPSNLSTIFDELFDYETFTEILETLSTSFMKRGNRKVYDYLIEISRLNKFSVLMIFITAADRERK